MNYYIYKILILVFVISSTTSYSQNNNSNTHKKTIVFIDDFNTNSTLEPNYYKYFDNISEEKTLGDLNYKRLNVDFDIYGNKSIRSVNLNFKPDYIVLILGTSTTTINSSNNTTIISATDYKNEYVDFVRRITPHGATIIIVSPPPYSTTSKEEDNMIIENIDAVQYVAENSSYDKIYYVKLYKHILRNYQESSISHKQLSTWITALIKEKVSDLN